MITNSWKITEPKASLASIDLSTYYSKEDTAGLAERAIKKEMQ